MPGVSAWDGLEGFGEEEGVGISRSVAVPFLILPVTGQGVSLE
jgi:hypothetical protein